MSKSENDHLDVNINREDLTVLQGLQDEQLEQLMIQKSKPLYSLWKSKFSLTEFKILDIYLSRINSHMPERRSVCFEKGELERILGVKKINLSDLKERLMHLMSYVVEIDAVEKEKDFCLITLFEKAYASQDDTGLWQVFLSCTPAAMEYFFNIEQLGYFRYKLRSVLHLSSRHSYILFLYLEQNRWRKKEWDIPLEELKTILGADSDSYREFRLFHEKVLKRAWKEINSKTECQFQYDLVRHGRFVSAVRFRFGKALPEQVAAKSKKEKPKQPKQENNAIATVERKQALPAQPPKEAAEAEDENFLSLLAASCQHAYTPVQIHLLAATLAGLSEKRLPDIPGGKTKQLCTYAAEKYQQVQEIKARQELHHEFSYFLSLIKQDKQDDQDSAFLQKMLHPEIFSEDTEKKTETPTVQKEEEENRKKKSFWRFWK